MEKRERKNENIKEKVELCSLGLKPSHFGPFLLLFSLCAAQPAETSASAVTADPLARLLSRYG
jgi:hypothetical protein